jgi:hypothetical protein
MKTKFVLLFIFFSQTVFGQIELYELVNEVFFERTVDSSMQKKEYFIVESDYGKNGTINPFKLEYSEFSFFPFRIFRLKNIEQLSNIVIENDIEDGLYLVFRVASIKPRLIYVEILVVELSFFKQKLDVSYYNSCPFYSVALYYDRRRKLWRKKNRSTIFLFESICNMNNLPVIDSRDTIK